jgi:hypothetical protein
MTHDDNSNPTGAGVSRRTTLALAAGVAALGVALGMRSGAFAQGKGEGKMDGKGEGKAEGKGEGKGEGKFEGKDDILPVALTTGCPMPHSSPSTSHATCGFPALRTSSADRRHSATANSASGPRADLRSARSRPL